MEEEDQKIVPFVPRSSLVSGRTDLEKRHAERRRAEKNTELGQAAVMNRQASKDQQARFVEAYRFLTNNAEAIKTEISNAQSNGETRIWICRNVGLIASLHQQLEFTISVLGNFFSENQRPMYLESAVDALNRWLVNTYHSRVWLVDKIHSPHSPLPEEEKDQPVGIYLVVKH